MWLWTITVISSLFPRLLPTTDTKEYIVHIQHYLQELNRPVSYTQKAKYSFSIWVYAIYIHLEILFLYMATHGIARSLHLIQLKWDWSLGYQEMGLEFRLQMSILLAFALFTSTQAVFTWQCFCRLPFINLGVTARCTEIFLPPRANICGNNSCR